MIAEVIEANIRESKINHDAYVALTVLYDGEEMFLYASPKMSERFFLLCKFCNVNWSYDHVMVNDFLGKLIPVAQDSMVYNGKLRNYLTPNWIGMGHCLTNGEMK